MSGHRRRNPTHEDNTSIYTGNMNPDLRSKLAWSKSFLRILFRSGKSNSSIQTSNRLTPSVIWILALVLIFAVAFKHSNDSPQKESVRKQKIEPVKYGGFVSTQDTTHQRIHLLLYRLFSPTDGIHIHFFHFQCNWNCSLNLNGAPRQNLKSYIRTPYPGRVFNFLSYCFEQDIHCLELYEKCKQV